MLKCNIIEEVKVVELKLIGKRIEILDRAQLISPIMLSYHHKTSRSLLRISSSGTKRRQYIELKCMSFAEDLSIQIEICIPEN